MNILICFQNYSCKKIGAVELRGFTCDHSSQLLVITVQPAFQIFLQCKRCQIFHIGKGPGGNAVFYTEGLVFLIAVHQKVINILTVEAHQRILVIDFMKLPEQGGHNHIGQIHALLHEQGKLCGGTRIGGDSGKFLRLIGDKVGPEKDLTDADYVSFFQIKCAAGIGGAYASFCDNVQGGQILFALNQLCACGKFFYCHEMIPPIQINTKTLSISYAFLWKKSIKWLTHGDNEKIYFSYCTFLPCTFPEFVIELKMTGLSGGRGLTA